MVNHNVNHKNIEPINSLKDKEKIRILFVCLGNICRSPAAEGIMKKIIRDRKLSDRFTVDSAGTGNWHVGQLPDSRMRKHGAAHGYTFDSRARQFSDKDFADFDHIITMDSENYTTVTSRAGTDEERRKVMRMADFLRLHAECQTIPDPYYGGDAGFEHVIELLEDACEGLIDYLTDYQQPSINQQHQS